MSNFSNLSLEYKPREKLALKGSNSLSDAELLAIILQSGYKDMSVIKLSYSLLEQYGSLLSVLEAPASSLIAQKGVGPAKVAMIKAVHEISCNRLIEVDEYSERITNPIQIRKLYKYLENEKQETLLVINLNVKSEITSEKKIFVGTLTEINISPREIFSYVLKSNSSSFILIHNHPSGNPSPSKADLLTTKKIFNSAKDLDLVLLDHIIIAKQGYYSMRENCDIIS